MTGAVGAGVTLLEHPLSPYAQKNKIALREKGVAFAAVLPEGLGQTPQPGGGLAANPRLEVPTLFHAGVAIFDSTIIQEYIEETWPEPRLLPQTAAERARVRMIEEIMDTQYEAVVWGFMEVLGFGRVEGPQAAHLLDRGCGQLEGLHAWLERELGDKEWFNGEVFGWGDAAVAPFVLGATAYRAGPSRESALGRWLARARARPSVALTAGEAAGFAASAGNAARDALRSGSYKREYRDHRLEWMIRSGGIEVVRDGIAAGTIRFGTEIA